MKIGGAETIFMRLHTYLGKTLNGINAANREESFLYGRGI